MCLLLRSGSRLATLPKRPDWWSAAEMVVLLDGSPISTEELWNSVRVTIVFLVTSLTNALLPRLLSLAGRPALHPFKNDEATVFFGIFNAAGIFWYLSPDLHLDTILSRSTMDNSDLMACFLLSKCVKSEKV